MISNLVNDYVKDPQARKNLVSGFRNAGTLFCESIVSKSHNESICKYVTIVFSLVGWSYTKV